MNSYYNQDNKLKERSPKLQADAIARNPLEKGIPIPMLTSYKEINQDLIADGLPPNDLSQIPESYSEGKFDGEIGLEASQPENWDYYRGWAIGHREYRCRLKGITLPEEF